MTCTILQIRERRLVRYSNPEVHEKLPENLSKALDVKTKAAVESAVAERVMQADGRLKTHIARLQSITKFAQGTLETILAAIRYHLTGFQENEEPAIVDARDINQIILGLETLDMPNERHPEMARSLEHVHKTSRGMNEAQRRQLVKLINARLESKGLRWRARNINGEVGFYRGADGQ